MKKGTKKKIVSKKKKDSSPEEDIFLQDGVEIWTPVRAHGKLFGYCREQFRPTFVTKLYFNGGDPIKLTELDIFQELKAAVPKSTPKHPTRVRDLDRMLFQKEPK